MKTGTSLALLLLVATSAFSPFTQGDLAESLLAQMTPEERVGQLFLLTFEGSGLQPDDPVLSLIRDHHISGLVLRSENNNFIGPENTLPTLRDLVTILQFTENEASLRRTVGEITIEPGVYVPLLIAVVQEGNGPEYSEIMSGMSTTPSQMAIGATWDPELSRATGAVIGSELRAAGINMLLGPSLDVLGDPRQLDLGDIGVRSFGGDPYWVGVLGEAFIEGVHEGSEGQIGVIAKHFPGLGGSDRPIDEEASTVRKSLVQLQQIELAPFFAVTDGAPGEANGIADGLLSGHIRYQGFQGNIRDTTRPIGLDPDAFGQLMASDPFAAWREGGGVTVSGPLGSGALRLFYESLGQSYRGHLVARDAFLAGNDLLYLSEFVSDGDADQLTTVQDTLSFFAEKYRDDAIFAQSVDEAVLRILRFKLRLYDGGFDLESIMPAEGALEGVGEADISLQVAREGATLLSPSAEELTNLIEGPPQIGERMVFITDVRDYAQCSSCESFRHVGLAELEDTILALYGTSAAGQVGAWNSTSLSMADLALFLGENPDSVPAIPLLAPDEVEAIIRPADWLVFVTLKEDPGVFGSNALKRLLNSRPDLVRNKRVVVFSMDVPYDLSATDISKIDVYYSLYGKTSSFVDVAARLLFQELSARGSSPVSVPGVGYDLIEVTAPDPDQLLTLSIVGAGEEGKAQQEYAVGDVVDVTTGVILDHNQNPVPDGTPVEFLLSYQGEATSTVHDSVTSGGLASVSFALDRLGVLTLEAMSEPARLSEILQMNVQEGIVTVITPTAEPSVTPEPSITPEIETPTPAPNAGVVATPEPPPPTIGIGELALAIPAVVVAAVLGYVLIAPDEPSRTRIGLLILVGGLIGYNYIALGFPGSQKLIQSLGVFSGVAMAVALALAASLVGYLWWRRSAQ
ncbi:MAG: glycoside hydrolase family 3 N-terminal domain-containing protein [Anaerolineales bacterium]